MVREQVEISEKRLPSRFIVRSIEVFHNVRYLIEDMQQEAIVLFLIKNEATLLQKCLLLIILGLHHPLDDVDALLLLLLAAIGERGLSLLRSVLM